MSSQPPAAREASQRGDSPAAPPVGQASSTTSPPSPSDNKRNNAAQLARELGSSSPWSETLMPQSYGTISPRTTCRDRQENGDINESTSQVEQDIDPPPVYTRNPEPSDRRPVYELPAETTTTPITDSPVEPQPLSSADDEQNQIVSHANPDVETPLLAGSRSTQEHGPCSRFTWRTGSKKQSRCCILSAVIVSSAIVSVLLLVVIGLKEFVSACLDAGVSD